MDSNDTSPGANSEVRRARKIISAAAKLMSRCADYAADREAEANGWRVFYAVDADVIKLYLAPVDRCEYADVFGDAEQPDTRQLLARLIGDFIFREFRSPACSDAGGGLFIVPPHDTELRQMIFSLVGSVMDAADQVERKMDVVLAELWNRAKGEEPGAAAEWLIDNALVLVEVFDGRTGPQAELMRFEALEESRLLNVERYKEDSPPWAFPLPRLEDNPEDAQEFTRTFEAWKKRVTKHKSPGQHRTNVIRDAYALATIEFVNRRMAAERRRLVLVTGTTGILGAGEDYAGLEADQPLDSFADLYIRHPQSFMADAGFFSNGPADESAQAAGSRFILSEWLDLFFPRGAEEGGRPGRQPTDRRALRRIFEDLDASLRSAMSHAGGGMSLGTQKGDFSECIINGWRTQVHTASVSRNVSSSDSSETVRALQLVRWVRQRMDDGLTLEQLRADLAKRAVQSLSSLYSSTSWLGLWSRTEVNQNGIRAIPALRFDPEFQLADQYCEKLLQTIRGGLSRRDTGRHTQIDLAEMYSALSTIDESHYLGHLIHALAYATKGDWRATRTLCRIALRTADELPEAEKRNRRGREAAYLLAVAERRLATRMADLDIARRYLDKAQERENPGAPRDDRFPSEEIAIHVAKTNFRVFVEKDRSAVAEELERIAPFTASLLEQIASEPVDSIREWVTQQLLTNVLDLALVVRSANRPMPESILNHVRSFVSAANRPSRQEAAVESNRDSVTDFIYLAALVVFGTDASKRAEAVARLDGLRLPTFLPFDTPREAAFRELVAAAARS